MRCCKANKAEPSFTLTRRLAKTCRERNVKVAAKMVRQRCAKRIHLSDIEVERGIDNGETVGTMFVQDCISPCPQCERVVLKGAYSESQPRNHLMVVCSTRVIVICLQQKTFPVDTDEAAKQMRPADLVLTSNGNYDCRIRE